MYKYNKDSIKPLNINRPIPHGSLRVRMWYENINILKIIEAAFWVTMVWVAMVLLLL